SIEAAIVRSPCETFSFPATNGVRRGTVTGVQPCALPIAEGTFQFQATIPGCESFTLSDGETKTCPVLPGTSFVDELGETPFTGKIGRAACRDRVNNSGRTRHGVHRAAEGHRPERTDRRTI